MRKNDVIHKTGSTQHIALLSDEDRATAKSNAYGKCGELGHVVFEICDRTDRQTDRQTNKQASNRHKHRDLLITLLRTPTDGEINGFLFLVTLVYSAALRGGCCVPPCVADVSIVNCAVCQQFNKRTLLLTRKYIFMCD